MFGTFARLAGLTLVFGAVFGAGSAFATTVIEANQVFKNSDEGIGQTKIVIDGNKRRYNKVKTKRVSLWVRMKGHPPARSRGHQGSSFNIGDFSFSFGEPGDPQIYRINFDYRAPRNGSFDAVLFCNGKLNELSGDARTQFLREGGTFNLRNAYDGALRSSWLVADKPGPGFEDPPTVQTWENEVEIIAQVKCAALNPSAGLTRTNPDTSSAPRRTNPDAAPTRTNPGTAPQRTNSGDLLPRLKSASFRVEPYAVEEVRGHSCPTKLRLYGGIETNRRMRGQTIFVGPAYLSQPKAFDFEGADRMSHTASFDLDWSTNGGSSTFAGNAGAAPRQDVSLKYNVVNGRGKLVESVVRDVRVTCE